MDNVTQCALKEFKRKWEALGGQCTSTGDAPPEDKQNEEDAEGGNDDKG